MRNRLLPTPDELKCLLKCDFETGLLTWRERSPILFNQKSSRDPVVSAQQWNNRYAGKPALITRSQGYLVGKLFNRIHRAHRVIWAMHSGAWPKDQIDHINGERSDNSIANLREVSHGENARNMKLPCNNTSGVIGVFWNGKHQRWTSVITINNETKYLGEHSNKADAIAARSAAEKKYGFHTNHGR